MIGWVEVQRERMDRVLGHFEDLQTNNNGGRVVSLCLDNCLFIANTRVRETRVMQPSERGTGQCLSVSK